VRRAAHRAESRGWRDAIREATSLRFEVARSGLHPSCVADEAEYQSPIAHDEKRTCTMNCPFVFVCVGWCPRPTQLVYELLRGQATLGARNVFAKSGINWFGTRTRTDTD